MGKGTVRVPVPTLWSNKCPMDDHKATQASDGSLMQSGDLIFIDDLLLHRSKDRPPRR